MTHSVRLAIGIIIVLLLLSAGGIFWYKYKMQSAKADTSTEEQLPAIKIILTNGCGFEGVAKDFAAWLEDKNVDIVSIGTARKPIYDKTIIVIRKGDLTDLKRLQRMTMINRYTEARDFSALADFEIIIGKDYEQYTKN
ncbi:MAG TPA: LytR C-terminal domain-containing protein [Candidatus Cloacimonadota bacterium]|nr:LytR C-terminal domain-containing protein [Candidatus Cloacimonadota bacterium]